MADALKLLAGFLGGFIAVTLVTGLIGATTGHDSPALDTALAIAGGGALAWFWVKGSSTPPHSS